MPDDEIWTDAKTDAENKAQAQSLRDQARAGGLRFEAYLPPDLAAWLLDHVERGNFVDPAHAVFVILGEHRDLEPHADLRDELLRRVCQAAIDDPTPGISQGELLEFFRKLSTASRPAPPLWQKLLP
jgi:hypothetical protein